LPYRELKYFLDIEVLDGATKVTTVQAGKPYTLSVKARHNTTPWTAAIKEVTYSLLSGPTAFMYIVNSSPEKELINDLNQTYNPRTFNVYFKEAGAETIFASGVTDVSGNRVVFIGTLDITVRPGEPDHAVFNRPIPLSQLGENTPAPVINRSVPYEVQVEVQDRFGNAVDVVEPVTIVSASPDIGDVGAPGAIATKTVNTVAATGIATFAAQVTGGTPGKTFDMTATLGSNRPANNAGNKENVGRLRVGRSLDRLEVFYSDNQDGKEWQKYIDPSVIIDGTAGEWHKITVKVVGTDTVITSSTAKYVFVSNPNLVFSATSGGAAATVFTVTNGVATFWVTANTDVKDACVDVFVLNTDNADDIDGSVAAGNRCGINFEKPVSNILRAVLYGDGQGRPDSLLIYYADGGSNAVSELPLIEKVTLDWPTLGSNTVITALPANIAARGDLVLHVNLAAVRGDNVPTGYTSIANDGSGMVKVYGGSEGAGKVTEFFEVLDAIGPVLANSKDAAGNPRIIENRAPGADPDTLIINLSEQPKMVLGDDLIGTNTLFYTAEANPGDPADGGTALNVLSARPPVPEDILPPNASAPNAYIVVVAPVAGGLREGNWIRFNPAGPLVDRAEKTTGDFTHPANKPHDNNRWVQLKEVAVPPIINAAWYTSNQTSTGKVDYAYIEFDKDVDISDWFLGGYIYFTGGAKSDSMAVTEANIASLYVDPSAPKVLRVDLSVAFKSSQSAIRTSGDMNYRIGFRPGSGWPPPIITSDKNAKDRAKPVLADTVILKVGSLQEDGTPNPDTLIVVYSEIIDVVSQPVTLLVGSNGNVECKPVLGSPQVANLSNGYSRVTYIVEGNLCSDGNFPTKDDFARINVGGGVKDGVDPPNVQDVPDNLKQPIKIERGPLNWVVKVKNNPFGSKFPGRDNLKVSLKPGAKGADLVKIDATIFIYDNLGSLVLIDTLNVAVGTGTPDKKDEFEWTWSGHNAKGRMVGTGVYLFKAVCDAKIMDKDNTKVADRQKYSLTRPLGVVRGKNGI
jgi:hypothetical protein